MKLNYIAEECNSEKFTKRYFVNYKRVDEAPPLVNGIAVKLLIQVAGAMLSTHEDLLKWNYALHNGLILNQVSL